MRVFSGREQRVKVKTPKSGSERLELVLENSHWHEPPPKVDDSREPDNFDYYSDPPTWERREEGVGGYYDDDADEREIVQCPSGHSASTCETDNTSSNRMTGGISRTWSIASDDGRAPEHPEKQVVIQNIARSNMDAIDEEINNNQREPVETQPDDETDGHFLAGIDNQVEPSNEAEFEDELLGSITRDFDEIEQDEGNEDDDENLGEQLIEPSPNTEQIESHPSANPPLPMKKAVSFDESHNSEFDFDIDEPANGGRDDGVDDDEEEVEQENRKSTLTAQLSTDTSVESVGYRVTTTWSKETVTSPKSALRESRYTSNSSVGSGGNDSSGNDSNSSQHSTRRSGRNTKTTRSRSPFAKAATTNSKSNSSFRLAGSERVDEIANPQPEPPTEPNRQKKSTFKVSQSGISDKSVAGSGNQSSNASTKPVRDPDSEAETLESSNPDDSKLSTPRRHPPEIQRTPSRKAIPQAGQFWSIPRSPSTFSAGAQSNVALDGYVEEEVRPRRQGLFSKSKKSSSDRHVIAANKKKSLFTQPNLLRRNTKKGASNREETTKPGRVFSLKRNKSTKHLKDKNSRNMQRSEKGVSTGSLSSRATNPSPFEEDARIINRRNTQMRDSNTTMDDQRTITDAGYNPRMKEKDQNYRVQTTLSPKSLSNQNRWNHQGTQTTNFNTASSPRSPLNLNPLANQAMGTTTDFSPQSPRSPHDYNPWASQGTVSDINNPFSKEYDVKNPPEGSYNLKGAGMPAIKWWTWKQPDEEDAAKDCRYCALMCMFPPEE
ncbi:hypothetical protein ACHAXS_008347 [Conticribra weissflogii]